MTTVAGLLNWIVRRFPSDMKTRTQAAMGSADSQPTLSSAGSLARTHAADPGRAAKPATTAPLRFGFARACVPERQRRQSLIIGCLHLFTVVAAGPLLVSCETKNKGEMNERAMTETGLFSAAEHDDAQAIRKMVASGIAVDPRNAAGETPLLVATHKNAVNAARALIEAGADVNAKDRIHDSPYLYAGASGYLEILKLTLAHGADLKSTNRYGGTALIPAAERGHVETVRTLIAAGVNVDHVNRLGWTALIEAIILGNGGARHQEIVQALIEAGANVNLADGEGVPPLRLARGRGYSKIADLLARAGAE